MGSCPGRLIHCCRDGSLCLGLGREVVASSLDDGPKQLLRLFSRVAAQGRAPDPGS